MKKLRFALCAMLLLMVQVQTVSAARCPGGAAYYAPRGGNDRNDGSSLHPVRTPQRAKAILSPGGGRLYLMDQGKVYFVKCVKEVYEDDAPTG